MLKRIFTVLISMTGLCLFCSGCGRSDPQAVVYVSIQLQAFFVERIAAETVQVRVLIGPGESPATFDPTPRRLAELAKARALLTIGVPMERSLLPGLSATMPDLRIFPIQAGILLEPEEIAAHGPDGRHGHASAAHAPDTHIWMSPVLARRIAENTFEALAEIMPDERVAMKRRLTVLLEDLQELEKELGEILAPFRGRVLAVFHPAYGYLVECYGLRQLAIETGGMAPSPRGLARILSQLADGKVGAIFVQPQFSSRQAESLAKSTGLQIRVLDPLARDYLVNMRSIAHQIATALDPEAVR